jgi:hypothetical protein
MQFFTSGIYINNNNPSKIGEFLTFLRIFAKVKGLNENPHFTTKMKIYRKYV